MAMRFFRRLRAFPSRAAGLYVFLRQRAAERRALRDIVHKPHDHWLEDAGLTRDEARRLQARSILYRIADRTRAGGK